MKVVHSLYTTRMCMHNTDSYSPNVATQVSLLEVGRGWVISMASFSRLCLNSKSNKHSFINTYAAIDTYVQPGLSVINTCGPICENPT